MCLADFLRREVASQVTGREGQRLEADVRITGINSPTVLPHATLVQTLSSSRWDRPRDNKVLATYCRRRTASPSPASIDQISTVVGA
ncbi:MAG: hypothetical protein P8N76_04135 [Pirellulaceae bacterium]|nr:hypothetical protein [Pirellulaceae bacterium]